MSAWKRGASAFSEGQLGIVRDAVTRLLGYEREGAGLVEFIRPPDQRKMWLVGFANVGEVVFGGVVGLPLGDVPIALVPDPTTPE